MNKTSRISKKKYSNFELFNKKEKDLKKKKQKLLDFECKNNTKLNWFQDSTERKSKFNFPFYDKSNSFLMSDRDSQLILKEKFLKKIRLDKKPNYILPQNIVQNHNLFITGSPSFISYKKLSIYNSLNKSQVYLGNNKSLIINDSQYLQNDNTILNNNYSTINNANILLQFENEKNGKEKVPNIKRLKLNRKSSFDNTKKILDYKIKKIKLKKDNIIQYINKTKEIKLLKYNSKVKNEGNKIKIENYENNIELFNDILKSYEKIKKLLDNNNFINKITEYIRFINSKKKFEKNICKLLYDEIIEYKNDIKNINQKIRKKLTEKNNILKWIYFQIQLKEKKLCLPSYYRTIIEKNKTKKLLRQSEIHRSKSVCFFIPIKKEVKKLPYVKRKNSKIFQKNQPKISPSNEFNSQNGLFYYLELDLNDPAYTEEINKIKSYKNHCIYNSIDEFEETFKFHEDTNIKLMKYYYDLKMNIFYYKRQLSDIKKYLKKQEDIDENSLRVRENDFNNLKEIFKNTMQLQQKYKNNNSVQDNNSDIYHYYCLSKKDVNFTILNKIAILNDTCKLLGLKYKPEFLGEKKLKKNYKNTIVYEILSKLKYINFVVDFLLTKFAIYNSNNYEKKYELNKLKSEIEANHKIEKYTEQRLHNSKKDIILKNRLEERTNKIYFLLYKKMDILRNKNFKEHKTDILNNNKSQLIEINDFFE